MLVLSQGRICSDNLTCCHTEIEAEDQTCYLTHSQYTDTGPTSSSAVPITPGAWQGSHWGATFSVTDMTRLGKIPLQAGFEPRIFRSRGERLNHQANEAAFCLLPGTTRDKENKRRQTKKQMNKKTIEFKSRDKENKQATTYKEINKETNEFFFNSRSCEPVSPRTIKSAMFESKQATTNKEANEFLFFILEAVNQFHPVQSNLQCSKANKQQQTKKQMNFCFSFSKL